ncbi:MAG TPA: glycosyltransferase, partial [Thermodesulfovibrionales bacterium]|nr:glycosyltransferase [Thermodesulfovibrionales bacterium]
MKIVYLVANFPTLSETFILNQITGLIDRGHEVEIIAFQDPRQGRIQEEVIKYGLLEKTHYIPYKDSASLFSAPNISELIPCLDADIIHCHFADEPATMAQDIFIKTGIPYIITAHANDIFVKPDIERLWSKFANAKKVITISNFNRQYLLGLVSKEFSEKIIVQYHGIDLDKFRYVERSAKDVTNLLFTGRLVEKKGILDAIEVFRQVVNRCPSVHFTIVGDGPQKEEVQKRVKEFNLSNKVTLSGSLTMEKVIDEMKNADIFFLPSVTASNGDREGLPIVLLEAQAMGLPVVSTLHTGIPEAVIDRETGLLLPEHDIRGMADSLCKLIENPDLRLQMGRAGRKAVEARHNLYREIDSLERMIKDVVQSDKRQAEKRAGAEAGHEKRVTRYYAQVMEHLEQRIRQHEQQIRQQEQQIKQQEQKIQQLSPMIYEHDGFIKGIQKTILYIIFRKLKPVIKQVYGRQVPGKIKEEKIIITKNDRNQRWTIDSGRQYIEDLKKQIESTDAEFDKKFQDVGPVFYDMYGKEKGLLDLMNHGLRYWAMCSLMPELNYSGSGNVLEIGCNSGLLSIMLKKQWPQLNVFAVDRDTQQIAMANVLKDLFKVETKFSVAEGENIGAKYSQGEFDLIYLCEILEHIGTIEQQKVILEKAIM